MDMVESTGKEKIKCPASGDLPCTPDCEICHGRGTVRSWTMAIEAEWVPPGILYHLEWLGIFPIGLSVDRENELHRYPVIVARVKRHSLTEAMRVACEFLADRDGNLPLVRKAW